MDLLLFFKCIEDVIALPVTVLFFCTALILTIKIGFLQISGFPRFIRLVSTGVRGRGTFDAEGNKRTINPFHALFTSMSTSIGMGSVVGPSIAIITGGPGALFWLITYIFFGSAIKYTEVAFALATRTQTSDGRVVGGPIEYLQGVHKWLAYWYGYIIIFLFAGWSSLQSNTLAVIYAQEHVPEWIIGLTLAMLVWVVLNGGVQRVGVVASKLVPVMFVLYMSFAFFILFKDVPSLIVALKQVAQGIINPSAAFGGLLGTGLLQAMRAGMYQGVYITESGLGTASIAHAVADTKRASDQGLLAMFSGIADIMLSLVSGLLILVTGVWQIGGFRSSLIYEVFKLHTPGVGQLVLFVSISLFVITTVIGNSFNGSQSYAAIANNRGTKIYQLFLCIIIFVGSFMPVPLIWAIMNIVLTLVAIPNLVGLVVLAFKKPEVLLN